MLGKEFPPEPEVDFAKVAGVCTPGLQWKQGQRGWQKYLFMLSAARAGSSEMSEMRGGSQQVASGAGAKRDAGGAYGRRRQLTTQPPYLGLEGRISTVQDTPRLG